MHDSEVVTTALVMATDQIARAILLLRGQRVLLDADLAVLYGVGVKALNQAVRRNRRRFPPDFMFRLTVGERDSLRSQFVTLKRGRGQHRKYLPQAFTEQGVAMLSGVLHSPRAIVVNVEIMRAFVELRRMPGSHVELARKIEALEEKCDGQFKTVFQSLRELMAPPRPVRRRIGFRAT